MTNTANAKDAIERMREMRRERKQVKSNEYKGTNKTHDNGVCSDQKERNRRSRSIRSQSRPSRQRHSPEKSKSETSRPTKSSRKKSSESRPSHHRTVRPCPLRTRSDRQSSRRQNSSSECESPSSKSPRRLRSKQGKQELTPETIQWGRSNDRIRKILQRSKSAQSLSIPSIATNAKVMLSDATYPAENETARIRNMFQRNLSLGKLEIMGHQDQERRHEQSNKIHKMLQRNQTTQNYSIGIKKHEHDAGTSAATNGKRRVAPCA